jgi:uncharacterized protein YbjT (DUF2867 family)
MVLRRSVDRSAAQRQSSSSVLMRILLTGASGFVGSQLLPRLLADGHHVRALARDPTRVHLAADSPVEVVRGDVLSGAGLTEALRDVEVAYYLIHSMEGTREQAGEQSSNATPGPAPGPTSFPERERLSAELFAAAARHAGVTRIVYLGGLLPQQNVASRHLASRGMVEEILLKAIPGSVALRASIVIGARSRSFRLLVRLVERMPILALPSWQRFRTRPVDARDVNQLLALAATAPELAGGSLDVVGPDTLTYGRMVERIAEIMLVNRPVLKLKVSLTPLAAPLAAALASEDPELILPLMEGLQGDLLPARDRPDAATLLGVPLHSFSAAVEHALGQWEAVESLRAR